MSVVEEAFAAERGRLQGLAYRMLASRQDAEDVLQDAYLRLTQADLSDIRNPRAYLTTVVTRLCLDRLKSARQRREIYVGPWLPEPIVDAAAPSPERAIELADDLSFALLLTLERLSPPERAAFLLHDVFDIAFSEIAGTLGKSEAACRQLAARARKAVKRARPAGTAPPEAHRVLLERFSEALSTGDASRLEALLTADAVSYSDGGGIKSAALNPVRGADKVARFFAGMVRKHTARGGTAELEAAIINGLPGFIVYLDGAFDHTLSIDVSDQLISAIFVVRNPEKLTAIKPRQPAKNPAGGAGDDGQV